MPQGIAQAGGLGKKSLFCPQRMRLYASKIPIISEAIVRDLVDSGDIEVSDVTEFRQDAESILKEFLRKNREITEASKDALETRGLPYSDLYRVRRQMAEDQDFGIGDEAPNWIATQLIELFMASTFVEEVYAEDTVLRRKLKELLRKHMQADDDLDREVRKHLKHLSEGTESFEIEYQKQLEAIKRKHGLS
jgi:hypothetical protein